MTASPAHDQNLRRADDVPLERDVRMALDGAALRVDDEAKLHVEVGRT